MFIESVGMVAGSLTTVAFLPQLLAVYRTKSAADLSYGYLFLFSTGIVLWLMYGLLIFKWPVILANAVTLTLVVSILALKLRYERKR